MLAVVFQPVENLRSLTSGFLIHLGFLYLKLKLANLGHLLRMHFIQLLLEIIDLLLKGILLVKLLIILLLGSVGIRGNLCHLRILIDDLLQSLKSFLFGIHGKNRIAFLICDGNPGAEDRSRLFYGSILIDIILHDGAPAESGQKLLQIRLYLVKLLSCFVNVQILYILTYRSLNEDLMLLIDGNFINIDTSSGFNDDISLSADLLDIALNADGIKTVIRYLFTGLLLLHDKECDIIPLINIVTGNGTKSLSLKINI